MARPPRFDLMMEEARRVALTSPNKTRKTGAVLAAPRTASTGHSYWSILSSANTFPPHVQDLPERHDGEQRYLWIEHAERNVIHMAARNGIPTKEGIMVTPWYPCVECARAIVGAGIRTLICTEPDWTEARYNFRVAEAILQEGGVHTIFYEENDNG